ncbi:DNA primase [Lacimicrobium alkaliphilum]|uniref:DNA primase n=1 Tax=Lacimicrobium alkaliphilum TaxID=1526571 RepID=A0ABQ1QYQ4_9ALTE|nr:DNA primase [Lacimicrobium alkaliphilum]GGD49627.1 DNA primase [Lacimicrobium alkaliphilum]
MAGLIPRDFIDDLLARTDIVELVDSRVRLKKTGRNYQACCPFHNEKTPSFTVSQDKQFYHCFGCGAHGNAISFLMEYDRLEFPDAIEELARYQGVEVPREQSPNPQQSQQNRQQKEDDYELMEKISRFFCHQLKHHDDGPKAVEYLKRRGLSGEVVKSFGIGYAPDSWDSLLSQFGNTPQRRKQMLDLRVLNDNEQGRTYDFFRDRIIFPIRDRRGRVVGFGGRVLGDGTPKYLNSPETRIYHKGSELYGYYQARQAHRRLDRLMVVEGYMDVVALAQYGIDYAVAALGTATTEEQVQLLFRAAPQIICCYDGDRAGRDAAWRALENALGHLKDGVEMRFLFLPDGEDPDSMVRAQGKEAFEQQLDQAVPLSKFFFDNLLSRHHVSSTEGKAALKAEAMPLIEKIAGEHQRAMLEQELSRFTGEQTQHQRRTDINLANQEKRVHQSDYRSPGKSKLSPVRIMLRLLLEQPAMAKQCGDVNPQLLDGLEIPGLTLLNEVFEYCLNHPHKQTMQVLEYFRQHPQALSLSKVLVLDYPVDEENRIKLYQDSFTKLLDWYCHDRIEALLSKSRLGTLTREEKLELNNLMKST